MIDELVQDLKGDEGFVPHVYQDHLGFWTLGFGFLVDQKRGGRIPTHIAEQWLLYAAQTRWNQLAGRIPWILEQAEDVQRAVANMAYNLGVDGVLRFRNMLAALERGDRVAAATEALDSRWAKQVPNRAKRVTDLMRGE